MTTFSILNYFYAIIFAFLLHPTVGGGERGTPTQATNTANKGGAGTTGHTLTHRRGGGGVRGRVWASLPFYLVGNGGRGRGNAWGCRPATPSDRAGGRGMDRGRGRGVDRHSKTAKSPDAGPESRPPLSKKS